MFSLKFITSWSYSVSISDDVIIKSALDLFIAIGTS